MFGLFSSAPFQDPQLGRFARSRGHWRDSLSLQAGSSVPLVLSGTRSEPDTRAVALARELPTVYAAWRATIEKALFEHYQPYADALAAGNLHPPGDALPSSAAPDQVWPHVSLVFVSIAPLEGALTSEFGYTTGWDEEHTVGARFQSGRFVELCGSVLPP